MKNEDKTKFVVLVGASVVAVGASAMSYVKTVRTERAKRREIKANTAKSIAAIQIAAVRVEERIIAGVYDGPDMLFNMLNDLQFEQIVVFNEE